MPELTYGYVSDMRKEFLQLWNGAHTRWQEWEDFYEARHKIRYAVPAEVRKLAIGRAKINAMVDSLVTREPTVTRKPVGEGKEHEARADKVEKWATALLLRVAMGGSTAIPPFRTAATYLALLGYAVGVIRWDEAAWEGKGKVAKGPGYKKRLELARTAKERVFPYIIEFPHPGRILLPPMEKRPSVGIETASMYGWQVEAMLGGVKPGAVSDLHTGPYDLLEVVNYWDERKKGLFVAGQEVQVGENGLGKVPFAHAYTGYGFEHSPIYGAMPVVQTGGSVGGLGPRPEDYAIGLLAGVEDSIRGLDEFITAMGYLAQRAAYTQVYTKEDAEELARKMEQAGLGGVVPVTDPEGIKFSEIPNVGGWMFQVAETHRRNIDEGTFQGVVQGDVDPRVKTATGMAMQLGSARMRFDMPMTQLNLMAEELLGIASEMGVLRGERVRIGEVTCGEEEFEGNYEFDVDFMAKDEGQKMRDKAQGMEEVAAGLLDFDGYQQDVAGRPDASGIRRKIFIDRARLSEQVQGAVIQAAVGMFQQKLAEKKAKEGTPPATPAPSPFVGQPGGPAEAAGVQAGMEEILGVGMERVVPGG